MGNMLLFGFEEGLYLFETGGSQGSRLTPISSRKYAQLSYIEETGPILLSRSGKNESLCIHLLADVAPERLRGNFEAETNVKKFKEAKECDFFNISTIKHEVYLSIAKNKTLLIMKWAPHPLMKFMKLKVWHQIVFLESIQALVVRNGIWKLNLDHWISSIPRKMGPDWWLRWIRVLKLWILLH